MPRQTSPIQYFPFKKTKKYIAFWKDELTGRKYQRAFSSHEEAEIFLENISYRKEKIFSLLHQNKTRDKMERQEKITLENLCRIYFNSGIISQITKKQNSYHMRPLIALFGNRQAVHINNEDIFLFIEQQKIYGLRQTTINRRISILRIILNWGISVGLFKAHKLQHFRLPKSRSQQIMPPTPEELRRIRNCAKGHIERILLFGVYCGPRIGQSELFRLQWGDIDLVNGIIHMPNAHKGARQASRDIPIREDFLPLLQAWMAADRAAGIEYCIHWRGKPVRNIHHAWYATLRRAGIERRFPPYSLRHAHATYALQGGAKIKPLAKIMGHANEVMILQTYQHILPEDERETVESVPDIFQLGGRAKKGKKMSRLPHGLVSCLNAIKDSLQHFFMPSLAMRNTCLPQNFWQKHNHLMLACSFF